jgi:hypothetical protein
MKERRTGEFAALAPLRVFKDLGVD